MSAGLSLPERRAVRQKYRAEAIARADKLGRSLRCSDYAVNLDDPQHQLCRGEDRGGAGCLCECHDPRDGDG